MTPEQLEDLEPIVGFIASVVPGDAALMTAWLDRYLDAEARAGASTAWDWLQARMTRAAESSADLHDLHLRATGRPETSPDLWRYAALDRDLARHLEQQRAAWRERQRRHREREARSEARAATTD